MANEYDYEIGVDYATRTNVEALTVSVFPPKSSYQAYATTVRLGDGKMRGVGFPIAIWRWGFLSEDQRDQLRTFCTGPSADVLIRTRTNESSSEYKYFNCVMEWPQQETKEAGRFLQFEIKFTHLVEYTPP